MEHVGIIFGSDDYAASIGATRTPDATECLMARQTVVVHAKARRMQAIDLVHINFKDLDHLKTEAEQGSVMGFTGKQCIHPAQIDIVQEAFSPSHQDIEYAQDLVAAFEQHQVGIIARLFQRLEQLT